MQSKSELACNPTANVVIKGKSYNTFTEPPKALERERENSQFDVRQLTYYLDGGKDITEIYERIMLDIERDPTFNNDNFYDRSKEEQREQTLERVGVLSQKLIAESEEEQQIRYFMTGLVDMAAYTRTFVHYGLFFNGVRGSGTDEQFKYWVDKGAKRLHRFFGCFSMTELGHGSNVAGLETTATFDKKTQEFIINTPNEGAIKWWIGGAAHTATHSLVFARLIVDGKDYGVKNFVVPLRNLSDFTLKKGVALGDIGKKMGRDGIDNGWIRFTNVRIPRTYMLMRYAQVDPQGNVTQPPLAQLAYGALITGRVKMTADSYHMSKRFLTIAIRYAAVRRQFTSVPGTPETFILDYPYHQRRLIPRLAFTYAMNAASAELDSMYHKATTTLGTVDQKDKQKLESALQDIKELFSASAGLKAFSTWATAEIIDETRQACGGQGYSGYNAFGQAYNDWVVQCTWEGDNNVLTLSAGRSLIQSGLAVRNGKPVGKAVSYILRAKELENSKLGNRNITDPAVIIEAWESVSAKLLSTAVDKYQQLVASGSNAEQAFETLSQWRFEVARVHTRLYLIRAFFDRISEATDESIKPILTKLAVLFGLWSIEKDKGSFLQSGFIQAEDVDELTLIVDRYCAEVRHQAIGLTDAFNLSDFFINSAIANYDGDTYKHYFEKVQRQNPPKNPNNAPYYETKIRPFLFRTEEEDD